MRTYSVKCVEQALEVALQNEGCPVCITEFLDGWVKFEKPHDFSSGHIQYGLYKDNSTVGTIELKEYQVSYFKILSGKRNIIGEWAEQILDDIIDAEQSKSNSDVKRINIEVIAQFYFTDEDEDARGHTRAQIYIQDGYAYYDRAYYISGGRYYYLCRFDLGEIHKLLHYIADNNEIGLEDYLKTLEGYTLVELISK